MTKPRLTKTVLKAI